MKIKYRTRFDFYWFKNNFIGIDFYKLNRMEQNKLNEKEFTVRLFFFLDDQC